MTETQQPSWPYVWQDETFGGPDPAPTSSGPAAPPLSADLLRSAAAPEAASSPVASVAPSELAQAGTPEATETARQARIAELQAKGNKRAIEWDELGGLLLGGPLKSEPELPTEQPPVELKPEQFPTFEVPAHLGLANDDPLVETLRTVAGYAEIPQGGMQNTINYILSIVTKSDPVEDVDAIAAMEAKATKAARARYGQDYETTVSDVWQARTILATESEDLRDILDDPRVKSDPQVFEALAVLGAKARTYYTRRHGTQSQQVVW